MGPRPRLLDGRWQDGALTSGFLPRRQQHPVDGAHAHLPHIHEQQQSPSSPRPHSFGSGRDPRPQTQALTHTPSTSAEKHTPTDLSPPRTGRPGAPRLTGLQKILKCGPSSRPGMPKREPSTRGSLGLLQGARCHGFWKAPWPHNIPPPRPEIPSKLLRVTAGRGSHLKPGQLTAPVRGGRQLA